MKRPPPPAIPMKDATEAMNGCVWLLHRHGCSKRQLRSMFEAALKKCDRRPPPVPARAPREMPEAGEILTEWHLEPLYLRRGKPRVLPRRGRTPSFESLARSIRTDWDTEDVLRYLMRSGAVRREGSGYVPTRRTLILLGFDGPAAGRNVRGLNAMLRTNAHNLTIGDPSQGLFERTTENFSFPVSQVPEFDEWLRLEGTRFSERIDERLRSTARAARHREPRLLIGVGIYRYQQKNLKKRSR